MTKETLKKFILPAAIAVAAVAAIIVAVVVSNNKEEVYRLIKVKSFEGAVTIQREETMDAFEGLQLISEDSVEVGEASLLELLADSDKHIVAEENTAFELHSTGTETSGNITIDLLYGKSLFTIDNKLNDESTFEVKTPNATMSVRGTQFEVEYRPEIEETIVEVFEGGVHVIYYGKEELLEKGDVRIIRLDGEETTTTTVLTTTTVVTTTETENQEEENPVPEPEMQRAFEVRYANSHEYSGIYVMNLKDWSYQPVDQNSNKPDVFTNDKVKIRYWAHTEAEMNEQIELSAEAGNVVGIDYRKNDDGDTIICQTCDFNGTAENIEIAYIYYKEINDNLYLSIMVYDENGGEYLEGTDISTYLPLTNNSYYSY